MNKDYRNTDYCSNLQQIEEKKTLLENKIRGEHPRTKIVYNQVHIKDGPYFSAFLQIYNGKCAYCGASVLFTDKQLFEVDHYICESSFENSTEGKAKAGQLSNLVFACFTCNRGKGNLLIKDDYRKIFNPDDSSIVNVFYRDEDYYIRIRDTYKDDPSVKEFYEKLHLEFQTRRLDYLLLEMQGLFLKLPSGSLKDKLAGGIAILMQKRNCISCS